MYVLISGKQGSGKTEVSNHLVKLFAQKRMPCWQISMALPVHDMHRGTYILAGNYGVPPKPEGDQDLDLMNSIRDWGRRKSKGFWTAAVKHRVAMTENTFRKPNAVHVILIQDLRFVEELKAWPSALSVWLECDDLKRLDRAPDYNIKDPWEVVGPKPEYLDKDSGFSLVIDSGEKTTENCAQEIYNYFAEKLDSAFA